MPLRRAAGCQIIPLRSRSGIERHSLPLAERAAFGCHAQLRPGRALANPAAAGASHRAGIPLRAGSAGGFTGGEDVWRCGGKARGGPVEEGFAEAGGLLREAWRIGFDLSGVLGRVLASLHAAGACPFTRASAVQAEAAGVYMGRDRRGVLAGHEMVTMELASIG